MTSEMMALEGTPEQILSEVVSRDLHASTISKMESVVEEQEVLRTAYGNQTLGAW